MIRATAEMSFENGTIIINALVIPDVPSGSIAYDEFLRQFESTLNAEAILNRDPEGRGEFMIRLSSGRDEVPPWQPPIIIRPPEPRVKRSGHDYLKEKPKPLLAKKEEEEVIEKGKEDEKEKPVTLGSPSTAKPKPKRSNRYSD